MHSKQSYKRFRSAVLRAIDSGSR